MSATPMRDVRRLPFSPSGDRPPPASAHRSSLRALSHRGSAHRQSLLPASPYTPFSGRRSGSVPPGTPQLPHPRPAHQTPALHPAPPDTFTPATVDAAMRAVTVDSLGALARLPADDTLERALALILADAVTTQMSLADARVRDRATHPHVRRDASSLWHALRLEVSTWRLLLAVWKPGEVRAADLTSQRLAPDHLDAALVDSHAGIVKAQRVAHWLEDEAGLDLDRAGGPRVKPLDDPAYRLAYSAARAGADAVPIDFDALGGELDETEAKAGERLCRELFRLLRAGRPADADAVCRAAGQPWRAAILAGGKRCSAVAANGRKGAARAAWRAAVASMARSRAPVPPHERALYGLLAGVMEPALAVAADYEAHAWVRVTAALDAACEVAVAGAPAESALLPDAALLQLFQECDGASAGHDSVPGVVHAELRAVRALFALGEGIGRAHLDELLAALAQLARTGWELRVEWVCRLAACMALFLKRSGVLEDVVADEGALADFEDALAAYPKLVIESAVAEDARAVEAGTILPARPLVSELSALLLSELLTRQHVVNIYAGLMVAALRADLRHERAEAQRVGIAPREVHDRRTLCLEKAGTYFDRETLDMLVLHVVDQVWDAHMVTGADAAGGAWRAEAELSEIGEDDVLAYRAIEFLLFPAYPNYEEAVLRATTAARRFFLNGRNAAARRLIEWFPGSILDQSQGGEVSASMREFDAWRAYMDALARHAEWRAVFYGKRPVPLPASVRAAATAPPGSVSYEVAASATVQLENYDAEMASFNNVVGGLCGVAVDALRGSLMFDGGWMKNARGTVPDDAEPELAAYMTRRAEEIDEVRRMAIPQIVALLHNVFRESGLFEEAVDLAVLVADKSSALFESFGKVEMKEFLKQIADSAVLLADKKLKNGDTKRPYKGYFFEEFA